MFLLRFFVGNPIKEQIKPETEIARTNWTALADEWISAKARAAEKMDVALLPFNERYRVLPPTAETFIVNGTNAEQMARVRNQIFIHSYLLEIYTSTRPHITSILEIWRDLTVLLFSSFLSNILSLNILRYRLYAKRKRNDKCTLHYVNKFILFFLL